MSPLFPVFDLADKAFADAELGGKSASAKAALKTFLYAGHVSVGKSRFGVPFTNSLLTAFNGVKRVVSIGAGDQVIRPDASRIVAGVAKQKPTGNRTLAKFVSNAVRALGYSVNADGAVTRLEQSASPSPAFAALIDFGPKAITKIAALPLGLRFGATLTGATRSFVPVRWRQIKCRPAHVTSAHRSFFLQLKPRNGALLMEYA